MNAMIPKKVMGLMASNQSITSIKSIPNNLVIFDKINTAPKAIAVTPIKAILPFSAPYLNWMGRLTAQNSCIIKRYIRAVAKIDPISKSFVITDFKSTARANRVQTVRLMRMPKPYFSFTYSFLVKGRVNKNE